MKNLIVILLALLSSCAQLMHGQSQPVKAINEKQGIFFTSCSGAVEDWASCHNKAIQTCPKGYQILDKSEDVMGGIRKQTFQCKK